MFRKGFILVTVLLVLSLVVFLAFNQLLYLQTIDKKNRDYQRTIQIYNQTKSQLAYQKWLSGGAPKEKKQHKISMQ